MRLGERKRSAVAVDWTRRRWLHRLAAVASCAILPAALARSDDATPLVVYCQDTTANDYRAAQVRAAQAWFAHHLPECRFVVRDAGASVVRQALDLLWAAEHHAAVVLLGAAGGWPLLPVLQDLRAAGVRIVALTRLVPGFVFDTFIAGDDYQIGARAAHFLGQRRPEGGRVAMLEGLPASSAARQRGAGFRDTLRHYPQWRLVAAAPADYLRHRAVEVIEAWHEAGLRYEALFAHSDSMLVGARLAWRRLGVDPRALITIGVDYIAAARNAILAGTQSASFRYPLMIAEAGEAVRRWLTAHDAPLRLEVPSPLITRTEAVIEPPIF